MLQSSVWARVQRFLSDRKGGVAVMTAVVLTALLGAAGLGTEATVWYATKRSMQGAADTGAFTAAVSETTGQNSAGFQAAAKSVTAQYGYADGSDSVVVTVNNPPKSGNYTTSGQAIEVIVSQTQQMLFSNMFLSSAPAITVRAVALPGSNGNGCVMSLDKGDVTDETDVGNSQIILNGCSVYVNSPSSSALNITGTAEISALSAFIVGNYTAGSNTTFTTTSGIHTGATAAMDPYASLSVPSFSGCNQSSFKMSGGSQTLGPSSSGGTYVFCSGIKLTSSSTLNLQPGVYIVDGGDFSMSAQSTIECTSCSSSSGVSIILSSSGSASSIGTVSIEGGATVSLQAPPTGPTAGIAFYQDRRAPNAGVTSNSFAGGSTMNIEGAIYFPSQGVTYTGGSNSTGAAECTQLLAYQIKFSGTTNFNSNCTGSGTKNIGLTPVTLVE